MNRRTNHLVLAGAALLLSHLPPAHAVDAIELEVRELTVAGVPVSAAQVRLDLVSDRQARVTLRANDISLPDPAGKLTDFALVCDQPVISEPHFELVRINEVAELVAKFLRGTAERSGVTIDLSELGDAPPVEIDRKRMYNALYNLINNAIPETPAGGKISLHARVVDDEARPQLEIRVRDTGRGMPARVRESLFTDHTETTKVGGTGLGTRIVKNVVEAHNGTISVHSEEGRGTEFVIRIPTRQDRADS